MGRAGQTTISYCFFGSIKHIDNANRCKEIKLVSFFYLFKNLEARLDFRRSLVSGLPSPSAGSFPEQRLVIELTLRRENSLCSQVINRSIFCDMNTVRYCYVAIYSAASSCELHSSLMVCSTFACKWSFFANVVQCI